MAPHRPAVALSAQQVSRRLTKASRDSFACHLDGVLESCIDCRVITLLLVSHTCTRSIGLARAFVDTHITCACITYKSSRTALDVLPAH